MTRLNKADFWAELDATDEIFVRRKWATGGYPPAKRQMVREWLALQDAKQRKESAAARMKLVGRTAFWTSVTAYATALTAFAAVASLIVK